MAGRLLPIVLTTVSGVAIGIATFGEEFKAQQRRRLQEEHDRDIAAASSLNSKGPSPVVLSTIKAPQPEQLPIQPEAAAPSKISSMLGLWAWSSKKESLTMPKEDVSKRTAPESPKERS